MEELKAIGLLNEFINANTFSGEEREQLHEALSRLENKGDK